MLLKQEVLHDTHARTHTQRERERQTDREVPRFLNILTIAWASVWSNVHQQLQALVRTVEDNFRLPPHGKGIQQNSGVQEMKREHHIMHKIQAQNSSI